MNALYVTVSISLLLVLAGFNHAHGLTTFGKTTNQGTQQPQSPAVSAKHCTNQANCTFIKGTTCMKGYCYCGDNTHPINGACSANLKGPRHICLINDECIEGAVCMPPKDKYKSSNGNNNQANVNKICQCEDALSENSGICAGASSQNLYPGLFVLIVTGILKTIN